MTVYIVVYLLIIIFAFVIYNFKTTEKIQNRLFLIFSSILLILISGFRGYYVGSDTKNYAEWFSYLSGFSFKDLIFDKSRDIEIGYKLFSYILSKISNNPRIVIFVSSVFIVISIMFFLYKYSDNLFISVILFLGLNHFFTAINTYRMYLGLAIIVWAFDALHNKRILKALLLCALGFLFHRMSIVFSAIMLVSYLLRNKRRYVLIAFAAEVLILPFIQLIITTIVNIFPKYKVYIEEDNASNSIGTLNLLLFILEVLIIVLWLLRGEDDKPYINMLVIMLSFSSFFRVVGNTIPRGFRVVQLLNFVTLLIIPYMFLRDKNNRKIYIPVISLFSFSLFIYYMIINAAEVVPYTIQWSY